MFVFVWMFASGWVFAAVPSSLSLCLCVCVWGCLCGMEEWWEWWHKQGRVVGGWCQGLTPTIRLDAVSDSWLRVCRHPLYTVPPKGQHFNRLPSLDAPLSVFTTAEPQYAPLMHTLLRLTTSHRWKRAALKCIHASFLSGIHSILKEERRMITHTGKMCVILTHVGVWEIAIPGHSRFAAPRV